MELNMSNFIHDEIDKDLENKVYNEIHTRFPPEPNGYLHIGHAKAININFSTAKKYNGLCNLRFDDTNPIKEDEEYVNSIQEDIKWLGFDWDDRKFYTSNYFDKLYELAVRLIKLKKAYVCDLSADEMREQRGDFNILGENSPYRDRSVEENLELFENMKNGLYKDGEKVLRAKIDMKHPKVLMRDPVIYRISHAVHHNTGDKWCIYPMYDYAHPLSDALENITHSLCSKEFEERRELYNWFVREVEYFDTLPRQIEFARMNITDMMMSKRYLLKLVNEKIVDGWDDPRMPTISGMRRRGYTKEAIIKFLENTGVSKSDSTVEFSYLEHFVREDLKPKAKRVMAVLEPLKVVITNYPEDEFELLTLENNPDDGKDEKREVMFSREIYIERNDFMENPVDKYYRLFVGNEVRLKGAYFIKCNDFIKNENGEITEIHCTYDPQTKSGSGFKGRKVKSTIHWVSATDGVKCKVNMYDSIYKTVDDKLELNEKSLKVYDAIVEKELETAFRGEHFQFYRHGYFVRDIAKINLEFNLTVSIKDTFKKK